jgi:hypothetical protein
VTGAAQFRLPLTRLYGPAVRRKKFRRSGPSDRGASRELRRSPGPGRLPALQKMDMGRPDRMGFSAEGHGALMHAGRLRAGRMRQPNHAVLPM